MNQIKIIGRTAKNKDFFFCDYNKALDRAINNFAIAKTVKVFKGKC